MANTIRIKRSSTASNVPTAGELLEGELAINTNPADRKLYSKDSGGTVFEIAPEYSHPTHPGDDFSVDSGPLTGANVISDIDINVTTDTLGHVTDANGVIATRALTLDDIDTNSVKKNATETITGTWTFDGVVTTSDYGTGGRVKDGTDVSRPIGFNVMPVYEIDANDTFDLAHNGMLWHKDANATVTFSCPNDTTIPQGATYAVFNDDTELVTISPNTGVTLYWLEGGAAPSSGSFTIAQGGIVTVYKYSDTEWWAWGSKESGGGGGGSLSGLSDTDITSPADASFLIYDTGTGDWRDFVLSGDVSCTDGGVVTVSNDSHTHDVDNLTGLLSISQAWTHTGNNVGFRYGINGDYSSTGASTQWGATIWAIDSSWQGATAANNSSPASHYGIRWHRGSHSSANANIGEGLYVYTAGNLEGGIGTTGIYSAGALEVAGNADILGGLDVTGNITVTGTVDGVDIAALNTAVAKTADNETITGTWSFTGTKTTMNQLFINESSAADADVAGDGQFWVKNNAPNDPYYTSDTGIDYPLAYATYRKTSSTALDNANETLNMGTESVADAMVNGCWYSDNSTAYTLTLEDSGTTHFPVGAQMTVWNEGSGTLTINEGTGTTLYVMTGSARTDSAGGCTLGTGGYATIIRKSTTVYLIMGAGITP